MMLTNYVYKELLLQNVRAKGSTSVLFLINYTHECVVCVLFMVLVTISLKSLHYMKRFVYTPEGDFKHKYPPTTIYILLTYLHVIF